MALSTLPFPLDELKREQTDSNGENLSTDSPVLFTEEVVINQTDSLVSLGIDKSEDQCSDVVLSASDMVKTTPVSEPELEVIPAVATEALVPERRGQQPEAPSVSDALVQKMQGMLSKWHEAHPQFENIMIATADGCDIASVVNGENKENIQRLAIMSGSMLALSENMLSEMDAGGQNILMLEGEYGYVFIHKVITDELVLSLTVMARSGELLGKLLWLLRQLKDEILVVSTTTVDVVN